MTGLRPTKPGNRRRHAQLLLVVRHRGTAWPTRVPTSTIATRVGGRTMPEPYSSTHQDLAPILRRSGAVRSSSAWTDRPFSATIRPPGASKGSVHGTSRSNGATARAVTTSTLSSAVNSSARARRTATLLNPSWATTAIRKSTRRCDGSTRNSDTSARTIDTTTPGRPAPDPTSATTAPVVWPGERPRS